MTAFGTFQYDLTACPSDVIGFQCDHRRFFANGFVTEPSSFARRTPDIVTLDIAFFVDLFNEQHSDHFLYIEI